MTIRLDTDGARPLSPSPENIALAKYIIDWLEHRSGAEFGSAIGAMTVESYRLMHDELAYILLHGGHPHNWVKHS